MTVNAPLSFLDHPTDSAGLTYIYPVVSRRAGGLSVGINLNTNQACNWRCIYCQVPGLTRGTAPPVDLARLEAELEGFLLRVVQGDFLLRSVPADLRRLQDIALAGDGEPTTAREFAAVVAAIGRVRGRLGLGASVKTVLITNGSLLHRESVQSGIRALASLAGEVWFKVDRADAGSMEQVNSVRGSPGRVARNLRRCAALCTTWLQTCMFALDGQEPSEFQREAYLAFLRHLLGEAVDLRGVLLYGPVRQSFQPEAPRISALPEAWLRAFAGRIEALGLEVRLTP